MRIHDLVLLCTSYLTTNWLHAYPTTLAEAKLLNSDFLTLHSRNRCFKNQTGTEMKPLTSMNLSRFLLEHLTFSGELENTNNQFTPHKLTPARPRFANVNRPSPGSPRVGSSHGLEAGVALGEG